METNLGNERLFNGGIRNAISGAANTFTSAVGNLVGGVLTPVGNAATQILNSQGGAAFGAAAGSALVQSQTGGAGGAGGMGGLATGGGKGPMGMLGNLFNPNNPVVGSGQQSTVRDTPLNRFFNYNQLFDPQTQNGFLAFRLDSTGKPMKNWGKIAIHALLGGVLIYVIYKMVSKKKSRRRR
jgi:hypothetical protein